MSFACCECFLDACLGFEWLYDCSLRCFWVGWVVLCFIFMLVLVCFISFMGLILFYFYLWLSWVGWVGCVWFCVCDFWFILIYLVFGC